MLNNGERFNSRKRSLSSRKYFEDNELTSSSSHARHSRRSIQEISNSSNTSASAAADVDKEVLPLNQSSDTNESGSDEHAKSCLVKCKNGSVCSQPGDPHNGPWGHYKGSYCHCKPGFAGVECDHEAKICGNNELVCLNGTTCTKTAAIDKGNATTGVGYQCTCPSDRGNCNARKIDYCTLTGVLPTTDDKDEASDPIPTFCVNGGTCRQRDNAVGVKEHAGCHCPAPFTGSFCELVDIEIDADFADGSSPTAISIDMEGSVDGSELALLLFIIGVGVVTFFVLRRYLKRRRARWLRGDDIVLVNVQGFRDENDDVDGEEDPFGGGISANGNSLFPGMTPAAFD